MKTYFARLIAPRATFVQDMTPAERAMMMEHGKYWRGQLEKGQVVAFGLVAHPDGGFGVAILELPDDANVHDITNADPAIKANAGLRYDVALMPMGAVHK